VFVLVIILTFVLILAGFAGLFLPYLPDAPLVFAGVLLFSIYNGFEVIHPITVVVLGLLTLVVIIIDLFSSQLGVKKLGGSTLALVLSFFLGLIALILWNIPGLIIGTLGGALLGEFIKSGDLKQSIKVSMGSLLGFLSGLLCKGIIMIWLVGIFVGALIF